jgi:D-glycero-D-manno-heptose 1,7-bisphosphate phosphatase
VSTRAVLLDRDGTLNVKPREHEYVTSPEDFAWLPGAREAVARLARSGFSLAIVSNQRGVARGLVSARTLREVELRIQRDLRPLGCSIGVFRYCMHETADGCNCRKPKPGLLMEAADALEVDLGSSWMVGDAATDVLAGEAAGCRTALIGRASPAVRADVTAPSLEEATELILAAANATAA